MKENIEKIWDKIWYDKKGNIVIWQWPNIPLIAYAVFTCISLLFQGRISDIFQWLGSITLVIWSLLEIFKGANYFRRILGIVVLVFCIMTIAKLV